MARMVAALVGSLATRPGSADAGGLACLEQTVLTPVLGFSGSGGSSAFETNGAPLLLLLLLLAQTRRARHTAAPSCSECSHGWPLSVYGASNAAARRCTSLILSTRRRSILLQSTREREREDLSLTPDAPIAHSPPRFDIWRTAFKVDTFKDSLLFFRNGRVPAIQTDGPMGWLTDWLNVKDRFGQLVALVARLNRST